MAEERTGPAAGPAGPDPALMKAVEPPAAKKGCDILVECLEREGVDTVFAYPGGASMEIHQALTRSKSIRNILCRHEQGEIFAAQGFAKTSGLVGVCIATSGPGATNLVTGLADAMLDSVPLVAITGQVPRAMIGTDAFQETPIVEVTRQITKHNYLVMDVEDIPRVIKEAFFLARTGRPGPVLVDIPKDIQQQLNVPRWDAPMALDGYISRLPPPPSKDNIRAVAEAIGDAERPMLYVGGGCLQAAEELRELVDMTGVPVAQTLMGLGAFPETHPQALQMLGMHGTVYANYAIHECDLLIAVGVRFDDRVTGKLSTFASKAKVVHMDIDAAEIGKNKVTDIAVNSDAKLSLGALVNVLKAEYNIQPADFAPWRADIARKRLAQPMAYDNSGDAILPQMAIETLNRLTEGNAIIATGVGQHQMWSAQWYKFNDVRRWVTSGGLGSMGFGLPSALGCAAAFDGQDGRQKLTVVDIDGDGSFMMNPQELATLTAHNLDVKIMVLNNQHLGMVVQWEDRFYKSNHAHTFLALTDQEEGTLKDFNETDDAADIFPDFVKMAESCRVPARRIFKRDELEDGIREMLESDGAFLLDVMVPHIEHVMPMIPGGGGYAETIAE